MSKQQFAGAVKTGTSLISPLERRMATFVVPKIPGWLETHHLTWLTLLWCALIVGFGFLAAGDIRWLWLVSLMVVFQYLTDFFDGKVGKYRNTGLVKWGFYTDHFLDYVFLCAVLTAYAMILPESSRYHLFFLLAVYAGFMIHSFLAFAATGKFSISHLKMGPTEFRVAIIVINALLIMFGKRKMVIALPYVAAGSLVALCVLVYTTQKEIWQIDKEKLDDVN